MNCYVIHNTFSELWTKYYIGHRWIVCSVFLLRVNGSWQSILSEQNIKVNFGIGQIKESSRLVCLKNLYKIYWREAGNPSSDQMKSWIIIVGKSMIVKIDFETRKFKFESWHHYFLDIRLYSSCSVCNMRIITIL